MTRSRRAIVSADTLDQPDVVVVATGSVPARLVTTASIVVTQVGLGVGSAPAFAATSSACAQGVTTKGVSFCIPDRPEISEHAVHHFHSMVLDALDLID